MLSPLATHGAHECHVSALPGCHPQCLLTAITCYFCSSYPAAQLSKKAKKSPLHFIKSAAASIAAEVQRCQCCISSAVLRSFEPSVLCGLDGCIEMQPRWRLHSSTCCLILPRTAQSSAQPKGRRQQHIRLLFELRSAATGVPQAGAVRRHPLGAAGAHAVRHARHLRPPQPRAMGALLPLRSRVWSVHACILRLPPGSAALPHQV